MRNRYVVNHFNMQKIKFIMIVFKYHIIHLILIFYFFTACKSDRNNKEFVNPTTVNYSIEYLQTDVYPVEIDKRITNELMPNFPDSVREKKVVFLCLKYNYLQNSKKVKSIDTSGYFVSIRNDLSELFWELDFDSNLKITRSEELTFEKYIKIKQEGEKMR